MKKRSVRIAGHDTSVSLEEEFWAVLQEIAQGRKMSVNALVTQIDAQRTQNDATGTREHGAGRENLSSALRVFVLRHLRQGT